MALASFEFAPFVVRNALDETGKLSNAVTFRHTNIISGFHRSLLECVKCDTSRLPIHVQRQAG